MGHAGAFTLPGESDAQAKIKRLQDAGVTIVNHPAKFGSAMKSLLVKSGRGSNGAGISGASQRRGFHTVRNIRARRPNCAFNFGQRRSLYIHEDQALNLLRERGINASGYSGKGRKRVRGFLWLFYSGLRWNPLRSFIPH